MSPREVGADGEGLNGGRKGAEERESGFPAGEGLETAGDGEEGENELDSAIGAVKFEGEEIWSEREECGEEG